MGSNYRGAISIRLTNMLNDVLPVESPAYGKGAVILPPAGPLAEMRTISGVK
jgi:hypothetical protein